MRIGGNICSHRGGGGGLWKTSELCIVRTLTETDKKVEIATWVFVDKRKMREKWIRCMWYLKDQDCHAFSVKWFRISHEDWNVFSFNDRNRNNAFSAHNSKRWIQRSRFKGQESVGRDLKKLLILHDQVERHSAMLWNFKLNDLSSSVIA